MHLANYTHEVREILRGSLKTKLMGYVITLKSSFEDRIQTKDYFTFIDKGKANGQMVSITL